MAKSPYRQGSRPGMNASRVRLRVVDVLDSEVWQAIGSYVPNFHTSVRRRRAPVASKSILSSCNPLSEKQLANPFASMAARGLRFSAAHPGVIDEALQERLCRWIEAPRERGASPSEPVVSAAAGIILELEDNS